MVPHIREGTFLWKYMKFMSEQETPREYDFACGLWCLSATIGRGVVVARPRAPVHLNMYVILVSESGILRKSSSIGSAVGLTRSVLQQLQSKTLLIESKVTMGELLNELSISTKEHGQAQVALVASELAAMLGRGTQIAGIPALLTDLYDCPSERRGGGSLSTGQINLRNVWCAFLAGSTPSWLGNAVRPEIVAGGFTSRCYFVTGKQRKKLVAWPAGHDDTAERNELVESLLEIAREANTYTRIGITDNALRTFTTWYEKRPTHKDVYRESFESREDAHILRLAGLIAANERQWQINDDHLRRSIELVAFYKRCGTELFTDAKGEAKDVRTLRRVREAIVSAGAVGLSRSELYRSVGLSGGGAMELRSILNVMHELDLIRMFEVTMPRGRPKIQIVATDYLKNDLLLQEVARKLGME